MKRIAKMVLYRAELLETFKLFRQLGAGWLESLSHAAACVILIA